MKRKLLALCTALLAFSSLSLSSCYSPPNGEPDTTDRRVLGGYRGGGQGGGFGGNYGGF